MALGTILSIKELEENFQPLFLAEFTFPDGSVSRYSTHGLAVTEGGFPYAGNEYEPRILNQSIVATQALSENGIDRTPSVSVELVDVDGSLYTAKERASGKGFKGARLVLRYVLWQVGTNNFTSDSMTPFVGICSAPNGSETGLTIQATNILNLTKTKMPAPQVQGRCFWDYPTTYEQRYSAATDRHSPFYGCGYSADVSHSEARGNLSGGAAFPTCGKTREDCIARLGNPGSGLIHIDTSGRPTGNFPGSTWDPPKSWKSKGYVEGATIEGDNNANLAKRGQPIPLVYGTQWVDGLVLNVVGDANLTAMEVLLCIGEVRGVQRVVVNDVQIFEGGMGGSTLAGFYNWVNKGNRHGAPNADTFYDSKGDPYGSLAVLHVRVPKRLVDSSSTPRVRVLVDGPMVDTYQRISSVTVSGGVATVTLENGNNPISSADPNTEIVIVGNTLASINGTHYSPVTYWDIAQTRFNVSTGSGTGTGGYIRIQQFTENPVWHHLDQFMWANLQPTDFDIDALITTANKADRTFNYTDLNGVSQSTKAYRSGLAIQKRVAASEQVRAHRNSFRGIMVPSRSNDGKIVLSIESTLADQQPNPVPGSNDNTAIASIMPDGTATNGYSAYHFNDSNILKNSDKSSSLELEQANNTDTPNRISVSFQDRDNGYTEDSLTVSETEDITRIDQEVEQSYRVDGVVSYDQARRITACQFAKWLRGNEQGDTRGTRGFRFSTTFVKACHLQIGDLVTLTSTRWGLTKKVVRIFQIQPTANGERVTILVRWHEDAWYSNTFGQGTEQKYKAQRRDNLLRPAFPWYGDKAAPLAGDAIYGPSEYFFGLGQKYEASDDGKKTAKLTITGRIPANTFSKQCSPPFVPLQGNSAPTGGTIKGGKTYWIGISTVDAAGQLSPLSELIRVDVPASTNTNTISAPNLHWETGSVGYRLYAGVDPNALSHQLTGVGQPASITITSLNISRPGAPDGELDRVYVRAKKVILSGVWQGAITGRTATTFVVAGAGWTVNQFAGYTCSIIGYAGAATVPLANFTISSNTIDTLTITGPSPLTLGVSVGDVLVIRCKPSSATENSFTDPNLVLVTNELKGKICRVFAGTGKGQAVKVTSNTATTVTADFIEQLDSTSRVIFEDIGWLAESQSSNLDNSDPDAEISIDLTVENQNGTVLLVEALTLDGGDAESFWYLNQTREIYIIGQAGTGSMLPAPAVTALTLVLDTTDPDGFHLNTTWTNPSTLGSTKGMRRVAAYFDAAGATTPIDNTIFDLATFKFLDDPGTFPTTGLDGPFSQWPASDTWVEVWVGLVNGDNSVTWATSNREKIDGGLAPVDPTLGDVTVDDAYVVKEWIAGGCNVTSRYEPHRLPGTTPVTDTIAANVYMEVGANVTEGKNIPYTKAVNASPPADRQPFTIFVAIDWLLAVTPDVSGNRTIWIHACNVQQYSEGVTKTIPYKEHTLQGSFATAPVVFTQAEIDGSHQDTGSIEQPTAADFTVSILGYGYDPKDGRRVHIQVTQGALGANATYGDVFKYMDAPGGTGPAALTDWQSEQYIMGAGASVEWWEPWPQGGGRLFIADTAGNNGWRNLPTATTATQYVDIPAWGPPTQVTGASVTVEGPTLIGGVKKGRLKYQWTAPSISDANYFYCAVTLNWCNASFVQVDPHQRVMGERGYGAHTAYSEWWDWPSSNQYRQAKFFSVDWFEQERTSDAVVLNITVTANAQLIDLSKIDNATVKGLVVIGGKLQPKVDGTEVVLDGSGNVTLAVINMLKAAGFDTTIFEVNGGVFRQKAIATNQLVTALALITTALQIGGGSSYIQISGTTIIINAGSRQLILDSSGIGLNGGSLGGVGSCVVGSLQVGPNVPYGGIDSGGNATMASLSLFTALAIAAGGTGASNAAGARSNLGLSPAAIAPFGSAAGEICQGNDSRLNNARTPTSHRHTVNTTDVEVRLADGTTQWIKAVNFSDPNTGYYGV